MGRIRTNFIKKFGKKTFSKYKNELSDNFEGNKKKVNEILDVPSKQLRNKIAGYVTKLVKKEKR